MLNLYATDPLTTAERRELELFCDGPITPQMVADKIAQRGAPAYVPTVEDQVTLLKFIRNEIAREQKTVTEYRVSLVEAVADLSIAPAHDKDRCARKASGCRKSLESAQAHLDELIADEIAVADRIEAMAADAQQVLAAE